MKLAPSILRRLVGSEILVIAILVALGLYGRFVAVVDTPVWVDEAESAINALTILDHGLPRDHYLGIPIFENTLTEPWPESEEYEFRDSSYSKRGLAVYHGWLPLYSIAAAQFLAGLRPDRPSDPPQVQHAPDEVMWRSVVPRLPAVVFSLGFMAAMFIAGRALGGVPAGCASLAWVAVGYRGILYGHQARYYSLTLMLSALFFVALLGVLRRGRTANYLGLGVVVGLLFHTHQLSALVACCVAAMGTPQIVRQERWFGKCALCAGGAALMIFPWLVWSGFLDTMSTVPKAHELFTDIGGWTRYLVRRWREVAVGLVCLGAVVGLGRCMVRRGIAPPKGLLAGAGVLLGWILVGWVAFHGLVPAASFFTGRLTLMLLTPYCLIVGTAVGLACQVFAERRAVILAPACMALVLAGFGELGRTWFPKFQANGYVAAGLKALSEATYAPGTRFYAAPNDHLVWTYFAGLPVQSIAPIRKGFLDTYPHPIVFLNRHFELYARDEDIRRAAGSAGLTLSDAEVRSIAEDLWRSHVGATLRDQGMVVEVPPVPPFLAEVSSVVQERSMRKVSERLKYYRHHPMFEGQTYEDLNELWYTFYYRFVDPSRRIGVHANFHERFAATTVTLVPGAGRAIHTSAAPLTSPPNSPGSSPNPLNRP